MEYADWLVEAGEREDELRKEIARLQAEVANLRRYDCETEIAGGDTYMDFKPARRGSWMLVSDAQVLIDAAWNDAIEAAAGVADRQPVANGIAQRVRALKRPEASSEKPQDTDRQSG